MKTLIRLFSFFLANLCCSFALTSCAQDNAADYPVVALGSEPNSLDPAISLTTDVRSYITCMFEGLVNLDYEGNVIEGVACTWTANQDNTEYTFVIRDDAVWSNGDKITAEDFKYSWIRVLDPQVASGWASFLYYIKNAEKFNSGECTADEVGIIANGNELVVCMETPCSFFAAMTAIQPYFPVYKPTVESNGANWSNNAETYVSNGAFVLSEWQHDLRITAEKNPKYWDKERIKSEKIVFELIENTSLAFNAYESKQLCYLESILTVDEMLQVDEIEESAFTVTKFLSLNFLREKFADVRVREAIAIALDREQIATLIGDGAIPLCSFIPYGFNNQGVDFRSDGTTKENYFSKTAEISRAAELLNAAGYSIKNPLELDYLTNTSSQNVALAEIVKSQLATVGINVNVIALESKVFNERRVRRDFDIVASSWAAEFPDISSYLYGFQSTDFNNYASYNNAEFDNLYTQIILDSSNNRYLIAHQAEDLIMNDIAAIPLFAKNKTCITQNGLNSYYHDITGCAIFKYIWIK